MKRRALAALETWKRDPSRKPLVVRGARQVGKTWLLREFGRVAYDQVAYLNCQRDKATLENVFASDLDPDRILHGLQIAAGIPIAGATTLVVLDEIQDIPAAVTSLKYFQEQRPDVHLVAAGSLLGVALRQDGSFPVGKVQFLDLHPLDFDEFLRGVGQERFADLIASGDWPVIGAFHDRLVELLRTYMFVGGMPEAVVRLAGGATLDEVRQVQLDILRGYEADFAKYATATESQRIRLVWDSLPAQLAKENNRFIYGHVREGARAKEFEDAIQWLASAGLVHKVTRYTKPASPVRSYEDARIFKLYMHDVGLLAARSSLRPEVLLQGDGIFEEFKGSLTEQYVLQQIVAARGESPMYWAPEKPTAELDFAIERGGELVPIEVKAAENLRSKSLRTYINQFAPPQALRFSLSGYREQDDLTNVPLYAIGPAIR